MHVKFGETIDGNGGTHSLEFTMANFRGVGITLTGGTVNYVAKNGFSLVINDPGGLENEAFETTQQMSDRMVGQGEDHTLTDDDFMVHMVVHLTVNGNGVPTSLFLRESKTECR